MTTVGEVGENLFQTRHRHPLLKVRAHVLRPPTPESLDFGDVSGMDTDRIH